MIVIVTYLCDEDPNHQFKRKRIMSKPISRMQVLMQQLTNLHESGFHEVMLVDGDGLIVAAVPDSSQSQDTAALVAQMARMANRTVDKANVGDSEEITVRTQTGMRLICRPFEMGYQAVSLICTLPYDRAYRQMTNSAIYTIQQTWRATNGRAG